MKASHIVLTSLVFAVVAFSGVGVEIANAQTSTKTCVSLSSNIRYGTTDARTDGDVSRLQAFLVTQGLFNQNDMGTLHFGRITLASVVKFQALNGLPTTGYVGPMTRSAISSITCGGTPTSPVSLYRLNPGISAVGSTVSITGFGFTANNTVLMDGSVAARDVPITSSIAIACTTSPSCHGGINQTIQFTIPSSLAPNCPIGSMCPMYMRLVTPATYQITVQNDNGTSNTLSLVIGTLNGTQTLSITSLDAPSSLSSGQTGTWTVHAQSWANMNLHYSVVWGDEVSYGVTSNVAAMETTSSSATFTHVYSRGGTYTPTFTVTDDQGHNVTASNTLTVY